MNKYPEITVFELELIDRCLKEVSNITHKKGLEAEVQNEAQKHFDLNDQVRDLRAKIDKLKHYKMKEDS